VRVQHGVYVLLAVHRLCRPLRRHGHSVSGSGVQQLRVHRQRRRFLTSDVAGMLLLFWLSIYGGALVARQYCIDAVAGIYFGKQDFCRNIF
jgi:hypothetical protein